MPTKKSIAPIAKEVSRLNEIIYHLPVVTLRSVAVYMHGFVCPAPPGLGTGPLFPGNSTQSHSIHMTPVGTATWSCSQDWLGGRGLGWLKTK